MIEINAKVKAPYDAAYAPMELVARQYEKSVANAENQEIVVAIVRNQGYTSTMKMKIFKDGTNDAENCAVMDRLVKTLLWARGGYKIVICGSKPLYEYFKAAYDFGGSRDFDRDFMSTVYERPFEVEYVADIKDAPVDKEAASSVGRHLEGCRIGFDAGGSDRKVSAVIDGETVYSEETIWFPKTATDPKYQFDGILESMKTAAAHMPRVDAIGVSSAGVYIDNKAMVCSIFNALSKEDFKNYAKPIYLNVAKEIGPDIPIEVANDGDVTALAGAMDLNDNGVLGIAMGTSEAGGYVDMNGNITGWLNELAFAPVDFYKGAAVDEWSGDYGCGVKYFSQDGVLKLLPTAGIKLEDGLSLAEQLKAVQKLMAEGDKRVPAIYETIGVYFGYTIAYYCRFYDIKHVLIMGRVTSGEGGVLLLGKAQEVLDTEFPEIAAKVQLHIPDESSRRVGQSVAAASLPELRK